MKKLEFFPRAQPVSPHHSAANPVARDFFEREKLERLDNETSHKWHIAINAISQNRSNEEEFHHWLYEAKNMADEIPRLAKIFELERIGKLPDVHHQCSMSLPETLVENHLTCCLGIECRKCEFLSGLDKASLPLKKIDEIKAWTCAAHILTTQGKRMIDTSEGYVCHEGDKIYWQRVHESLANIY